MSTARKLLSKAEKARYRERDARRVEDWKLEQRRRAEEARNYRPPVVRRDVPFAVDNHPVIHYHGDYEVCETWSRRIRGYFDEADTYVLKRPAGDGWELVKEICLGRQSLWRRPRQASDADFEAFAEPIGLGGMCFRIVRRRRSSAATE